MDPMDTATQSQTPAGKAKKTSFVSILLIVCLLIGAFIYFRLCTNGEFMQLDDWKIILANEQIQEVSAANLRQVWTQAYFNDYVPLTWMSLMVDWQMFGLHAPWFRVTNLALHVITAVMFGLLILQLGRTRKEALFGAACYAAHPVCMQSVAWVSQRKTVLAAAFLMASILALARSWRTARPEDKSPWILPARGWGWRMAAALFFLAACLSKPLAVSFPAVVFVFSWAAGRRTFRGAVRETLPFAAVMAGAAAIAFSYNRADLGVGGFDRSMRLATLPKIWLLYVRKALWPEQTSLFLRVDPWTWSEAWPYLGYAALGAVFLLTLWLAWRRKSVPDEETGENREAPSALALTIAGWGWFAAMLVPVSGIASIAWWANERYMHFALPGMLLALIATAGGLRGGVFDAPLFRVKRKWKFADRKFVPSAWTAAGGLLVIAFTLRSFHDSYAWNSYMDLMEHSYRADAGSVELAWRFSKHLRETGDYDRAWQVAAEIRDIPAAKRVERDIVYACELEAAQADWMRGEKVPEHRAEAIQGLLEISRTMSAPVVDGMLARYAYRSGEFDIARAAVDRFRSARGSQGRLYAEDAEYRRSTEDKREVEGYAEIFIMSIALHMKAGEAMDAERELNAFRSAFWREYDTQYHSLIDGLEEDIRRGRAPAIPEADKPFLRDFIKAYWKEPPKAPRLDK
jgi:hypothetical protein